jgi:peptidoglycan/xylan/chitin deacetylase (PgdA/CDA1 family)
VSDVEADLAEIADPVFDTRGPQSAPADLECKDGRKLCISTGENGNIVGGVFPKGVWAFTYDDGPAPQSTSDIMDLFINYKDTVNPVGKATFFWTAANVLKNGQWVAKAVKHDFPIANHSYSHADLNRADTDRKKQIITSNQVIESAINKFDPGYKIQYFRCPYGSCYAPKIPAVRQMLVDQGQMHAYWRIDSLDWKLLDSEKVAALVIKQMQLMDHGVILMHDVHPTTVGATRIVLNWMKNQNNNKGANHKMVTIQEAVELTNAKK